MCYCVCDTCIHVCLCACIGEVISEDARSTVYHIERDDVVHEDHVAPISSKAKAEVQALVVLCSKAVYCSVSYLSFLLYW